MFRIVILARKLLPLAGFLALGAGSPRAHADISGRVLIVTSGPASSLLDEGLVRVRGELAAMGFGTEVRVEGNQPAARAEVSPGFQGALVFERFGEWLRIQAWNPATRIPVTQWIDGSDPAVDAEVIAIRAVEALRAALLPYLRGRSEPPEPDEPDEDLPAPHAPVVDATQPGDTLEPRPLTRRSRASANAWLGPALGVDVGPGAVHLGAQAGFAYGLRELSGGARFEATRAKVPVRAEAGEVRLLRFGFLLDARTRLSIVDRVEAYGALGGGIVHHRVEGIAAAGYSGGSSAHTSLSFLGELGGLYWFETRLGAYVSARANVAADAPVVRVDRRDVATLERPEIALSAGVMLNLD